MTYNYVILNALTVMFKKCQYYFQCAFDINHPVIDPEGYLKLYVIVYDFLCFMRIETSVWNQWCYF